MLITDPVYEYIEVPDELIPILDHPLVQRLRRIKQLAFVYLIYPSANHTRFEHSLGVMHVAGRIAEMVGEDKMFFQIAGLLHDIGHGPFSHLSEIIYKVYTGRTHEYLTAKRITELKELISDLGYDYREIVKEITKKGLGIVSGDLDADRIDYLLRDSYHTGNSMGKINLYYIISNMVKINGEIVIRKKAVPNVENILLARSFMRKTVYYHKTTMITERLAIEAIESLVSQGYDVEELMLLDDYSLTCLLRQSKNKYWNRVENRRLLKAVVKIPLRNLGEYEYRDIQKLEEELREETKIEDLFVTPVVNRKSGLYLRIKILDDNEVVPLSKISKLGTFLNYLEDSFKVLMVLVPEEHREEVNRIKIEESVLSFFNNP